MRPPERRRGTISPLQYWMGIATSAILLVTTLVKFSQWTERVDGGIDRLTMAVTRLEKNSISRDAAELLARQIVERQTREREAVEDRRYNETSEHARPVPRLSHPGSTVQ